MNFSVKVRHGLLPLPRSLELPDGLCRVWGCAGVSAQAGAAMVGLLRLFGGDKSKAGGGGLCLRCVLCKC